MNTNSEHWITEPKLHFGQVAAYGVSSWDMPDGHRLRREMRRSTLLRSVKEMEAWAKRYKLDITAQKAAWLKLESTLTINS